MDTGVENRSPAGAIKRLKKRRIQNVGSSVSKNAVKPGERGELLVEGSGRLSGLTNSRDSNSAQRKRTPSFLVQAARPAVIPARAKSPLLTRPSTAPAANCARCM